MELASITDWIVRQFTENDVFAGLIGGSFVASALYGVKLLPARIKWLFTEYCTVTMTVSNDTEAYTWIDTWLASQSYAKRARRLRLSGRFANDVASTVLSIGYGYHVFRVGTNIAVVEREIVEGTSMGKEVREKLSLRMLGRSQTPIRNLVEEARSLCVWNEEVPVFTWSGWWQSSIKKTPRSLESIILPQGQMERIVSDVEWFYGAGDWYAERGVPHRRGLLLTGPPGTGKSSLVMALASHFKRPICVLNLASVRGDEALQEAFWGARRDAILLIEDIDATGISHERTTKVKDEENEAVSLSCLLNVIDGVSASDGRLLVMTTNHPEKLDAALIRPGRVDIREDIGLSGPEEVSRMFARFFPGVKVPEFSDRRWVPAWVQGELLKHWQDADAAARSIDK